MHYSYSVGDSVWSDRPHQHGCHRFSVHAHNIIIGNSVWTHGTHLHRVTNSIVVLVIILNVISPTILLSCAEIQKRIDCMCLALAR